MARKSATASSIPYPIELGAATPDPYLKDWRAKFDYVLLLNADLPARQGFDADALVHLELVADRGFARLYRIIR